jgi:hypothetical protein
MTPEQQAAQNLIERALRSKKASTCYLLAAAAQQLDPTVNAQTIEQTWLNNWLRDNQNRNGESSQ